MDLFFFHYIIIEGKIHDHIVSADLWAKVLLQDALGMEFNCYLVHEEYTKWEDRTGSSQDNNVSHMVAQIIQRLIRASSMGKQ